ncbi:hypothetical protein [Pseudogracilibacillus sp. SO30301A]|uniref:hypothetical protein n=1 Tax=Pseudogracilibacillus sp. SO30301A TaxID=3098291 RepID=UPI00300E2762
MKRFFKWEKLPDNTTYYNDLQRFETAEDVHGLKETNEELTKRVLSEQNRVILDFDSSVNTVMEIRKALRLVIIRLILERRACIPFTFLKALAVYAYMQS